MVIIIIVIINRLALVFITEGIATPGTNVKALTSQGNLLNSLSFTAEITDKVL